MRILLGIFAVVLGMGAHAHAQLVTTITVKNTTAYTMTFNLEGRTLAQSFVGTVSPVPTSIAPGQSTVFTVTSPYPNIAAAHFYFQDTGDAQGCKMDTSYTTSGGYSDSSTSYGTYPTTCSAQLTIQNFQNHNYSVLFTIN